MGTHPIFESDFDCLTDSSKDLIWRTLLQPKVDPEEVSEVVSAVAVEAVDAVVDVAAASPNPRNGNPSPNSDVLSKTEKSRPSRRSTTSLSLSRSSRSLITSSDPPSRTRF